MCFNRQQEKNDGNTSQASSGVASQAVQPEAANEEPKNKRSKLNQKDSGSARDTLVIRLVKEGNKLVNFYEYDQKLYGRFDKENVTAVFNEETKLFEVKLKCLFCGENRSLSCTKYHAVSLANFKKHHASVHQEDDKLVGAKSKGQRTVKEMFATKATTEPSAESSSAGSSESVVNLSNRVSTESLETSLDGK